jgi:hypothetical protein
MLFLSLLITMKKKYFYFGLLGLILFEILNVYFIMPMPGSQEMNSIGIAYFLYSWRWVFRIIFLLMILAGIRPAFQIRKKWLPVLPMIVAGAITFLFNFKMMAEKMFLQPQIVTLKSQSENNLPGDRLVIGIENNGEAKAYPVSFLIYHHQVRDIIGGKEMMITYCSVCRTGRVFEPIVNGKIEKFRLVGMDHFNAMFEDESTKSWWRQENGEAITGSMKGNFLPEVESKQMSIDKWFELYPEGKVMQANEASIMNYDTLGRFEQGKSRSILTGTDTLSWKNKSWVVGIQIGNISKAYDWKDLKREHIINDSIGKTPIVLVLSSDEKSFSAFEKNADDNFALKNDTLFANSGVYDFTGSNINLPSHKLKPVNAYQEFWHSWKTFHPNTTQYTSKLNLLN